MQAAVQMAPVSKAALRTGWTISALTALFLLFDSTMKILRTAPVVEGHARMGVPVELALGIGIVQLVCTAAYLIPRTAVLGAILLTGYMGGAVLSHVRIGDPWFSHTLFPVYFGVLIWGGLYLRERRLRDLIPLRRPDAL